MTEAGSGPIDESEARAYRARFPIFDHTVYLDNCSLGPLSDDAIAALHQYQDAWSAFGAPVWWKAWLRRVEQAKERFARLINAAPHELTVSHSISSALSSIASTYDYHERPGVVCAGLDFPTIPHQWLAKARHGVKVRFATSPDGIAVPLGEYERHVDACTAHICTSHVFYTSGAIQPVRELAHLAHDRGAHIIIDGYHAVGAIPVDVKTLDVDFYVGGTLKWLLGGPGLTFIYVREGLIERLEPSITGWFATADQFAFDAHTLRRAGSADRLELGTPSVPTAYAGVAGMDLILSAGPERIWERLRRLTARVIERARTAGYGIMSPTIDANRGGIVMLRLPHPQETVDALAARGFTVDYRPGLLRVSPHFYNTMEDIDGLMDAIEAIQGRWSELPGGHGPERTA